MNKRTRLCVDCTFMPRRQIMIRRAFLVVLICASFVETTAQRVGIDRLTYWGGTGRDYISAVTQAPNGDIVMCGWTEAEDLQTSVNAVQRKKDKGVDLFITRMTVRGELIASTYYGGAGNEYPSCIVVEPDDNVLVAFRTSSRTLPVLSSIGQGRPDDDRTVLVRLSSNLSVIRSSLHLMFSRSLYNVRIQLLSRGSIAVTGATSEMSLPVTTNAYQRLQGGGLDGFVIVVTNNLDEVEYCTYDGGPKNDAIMACIDRGDDGLTLVGVNSTSDIFGDIRLLKLNRDRIPLIDTVYKQPGGDVINEAILRRTSDSTLFVAGYKGPPPLHGFVTAIQPNGQIRQTLDIDTTDIGLSPSYPYYSAVRSITLDPTGRVILSGSSNGAARSIVYDKGLNAVTERYELNGARSDVAYSGWATLAGTLIMVGSTESGDLATTTSALRPRSTDTLNVAEGFVATLRLLPSLFFAPGRIDLGTVPVGTTKKDSTLARVVNSRYPMFVESITPTPAIDNFSVEPTASVWVQLSRDEVPITVSWTPSVPGPMRTTLEVKTKDAKFYVDVFGNGKDTTTPPPRVTVSSINYGVVRLGKTRSRVVRVVNESNVTVEISEIIVDAAGPFNPSYPSLPVQLAPSGSLLIPVRFAPADTGSFQANVSVVGDRNVSVRSQLVGICGKDTTGTMPPSMNVVLGASRVSAAIGETFTYPVRIVQGLDSLRRLGVESVSFQYTYYRTILTMQTAIDSSFGTSTNRSVWLTVPWDGVSDTMALVQMTACIGDVDTSDVRIDNFMFSTEVGDLQLDTALSSVIDVVDSWQGSDPRVVRRDVKQPAITAYPNPVTDKTVFRLFSISPSATLSVYDELGNLVDTWSSTSSSTQSEVHITLPTRLSPGVYLCILRSNGAAATFSFVVL